MPTINEPDWAVIEAELAALGEPTLSEEEVRGVAPGDGARASIVAEVGAFLQIGRPAQPEPPFSEIEQRRAWRRVVEQAREQGARRRAPASSMVWRAVVAGMTVAACVALVPRFSPSVDRPLDHNISDLGEVAKLGLVALGNGYDTSRATELRTQYEQRGFARRAEGLQVQ